MADPTGFLKHDRQLPVRRPVDVRIRDWKEVYTDFPADHLHDQAARCMDCGIPFCHNGCPLGNLVPEWNDLVWKDSWREAGDRLHATNNFPEFTGRVCPAPCEAACVLGINDDPVSIKLIERSIADRAFADGLVKPQPPRQRTGKKVAVVGSGPAGMAAAQQLNRAGHTVTLFERDDRIGGLLTYGIPDFKMEKSLVERRVEQMTAEGVIFKTSVDIGRTISADQLRADFDAIVLTIGSRKPRDLEVPGRELSGIHFAMDFLTQQNKRVAGDVVPDEGALLATGKNVIVIGGGDTGSDCIGTSHRQGAKSVTSFEIMPRPPGERAGSTPWPLWPLMLRTSSSHEEGGERVFSVNTECFLGDDAGNVRALRAHEVAMVDGRFEKVEGTDFELPCEAVFLAMGFLGPEKHALFDQLAIELNARDNVAKDAEWMTNVPGVFVAGDMGRGQSLIVWAIAEGRSAAAAVDRFLMGATDLPAPISPTAAPQR